MFWVRKMIENMFKQCFMINKSISDTTGVIKLVFSGSDQMPLNTLDYGLRGPPVLSPDLAQCC